MSKSIKSRWWVPQGSEEKACEAPGCSELFSPNRSDQKYCSPPCAAAAHKAKKPTYKKSCPECGHNFETSNRRQVTCSRPCARAYQNSGRKTRVTGAAYLPHSVSIDGGNGSHSVGDGTHKPMTGLRKYDEYDFSDLDLMHFDTFQSSWVGHVIDEVIVDGEMSRARLAGMLNRVRERYWRANRAAESEQHRAECERMLLRVKTRERRLRWCYEERVRRAEAKAQAEVERMCRDAMVCDLERQDAVRPKVVA